MVKDEQRIKSVLKDFRVKNESEFYFFVNNTWNVCNCVRCGQVVDLLNCDFDNSTNPICKSNSCIV